MNEASEQYSEDIILSINRNMGKRDAGFLYKHQKGITGGVPTDRNAFDPTYVLRMAAGGQKVLTLDSNCLDDRHGILGHLGVKFTSGGTTIPLNLIETEQELKGSLK